MLTILEIPKQDPPLAAPPSGISPEKLTAVRDAEKALAEAGYRGASPQEMTRLLEKFWAAQKAAAPAPEPAPLDSCPSCGKPSERIAGAPPERRRCTSCGAHFSSTRTAVKCCPTCQSPLTARTAGNQAHCNCCGLNFFV